MNLELRKRVAEALGHKWDESRCRICGWPLAASDRYGCTAKYCAMRPVPKKRADEPPPYELDHHAALDALMQFCEGKAKWELEDWGDLYDLRYICRIVRDPGCEAKCFVGKSSSPALAICEAIVEAAKPKETP